MAEIPRPIRILVTDDDKVLSREIEARLAKAGFFVQTASDGASALKILDKQKFDLILLDLVMPGMTGFDVIEEVRKRGIQTPIAVLSLLGQEEDIEKAKRLGANDYFQKGALLFQKVVQYAEKLSVS